MLHRDKLPWKATSHKQKARLKLGSIINTLSTREALLPRILRFGNWRLELFFLSHGVGGRERARVEGFTVLERLWLLGFGVEQLLSRLEWICGCSLDTGTTAATAVC